MLLRSLFAACALLLLPNGALAGTAEHGTIDNTKQAKSLFKAAKSIKGQYIIKSATGKTLTFAHGNQGPIFYPTSQSLSKILKSLSHVQDSTAYQKLILEANHDRTVRISGGPNCLSAQWSDAKGFDLFGVAYKCAVGSHSLKDSTVRDAKQWWIFQEVKAAKKKRKTKSKKKSHKKKKAHHKKKKHGKRGFSELEDRSVEALIQEVVERGVEETNTSEVELRAVEDEAELGLEKKSLESRGKKKKKKAHKKKKSKKSKGKKKKSHKKKKSKKSKKGTKWYRIVATDHLQNQVARCITATTVKSATHQQSASIAVCKNGSKAQMWKLTKA